MSLLWTLLVLVLGLAPLHAGAATYYLNPDSGKDSNAGSAAKPWKTLDKVASSVGPGDTVNIQEGTYTPDQYLQGGDYFVWGSSHKRGAPDAPITIQADPGHTVIFNGQQKTYWIYLYATKAEDPDHPERSGYYLVINNLTFRNYRGIAIGSGSGADSGAPAHHYAVLNCTMEDFSPQLTGALSGNHTHHYIYKNNRMRNIGDPRLGGSPPPDSQHFIYMGYDVQYGVIDGNVMEGQSGFGIHFYGHHHYDVTTQQNIIRRNTIVNAHETGLILSATNYQNTYVYHNTFYQEPVPYPATDQPMNQRPAQAMVAVHLPTRLHQTVIINNLGMGYVTQGAVWADDNSRFNGTLLLDYNGWHPLANSALANWSATPYTLPALRAALGYEAHSIQADPRFVDAAGAAGAPGRDFTLQPGSPAIDAGTHLTTTVGSGSGTTLQVDDAGYFHDGFGLIPGDMIQVGTMRAQIKKVDYASNTLTLVTPLVWSERQGVSLPYAGVRPDMGAVEVTAPAGPSVGTFYIAPAPTGDDGRDCATVQSEATPKATMSSALRCGLGGSTFVLLDGTYPGTAGLIGTDLGPIPGGTAAVPTVIKAKNSQQAIIQPATGKAAIYIARPTSYVTFDGLVLDGATVPETAGVVWYRGADHLRFINGAITRMTNQAAYIQFATACEISNTQVHDNPLGIQIADATDTLLAGNALSANRIGVGMVAGGGASTHTQILGNAIAGHTTVGLEVQERAQGLIASNVIYNNTTGIDVLPGNSGLKVYNNTVWNNTGTGLAIASGASGTLHTNNIYVANGATVTNAGAGTVDTTNLTTDPRFVAPGPPATWHVQSATAIGQGTALAEVTLDFYRRGRTVPYTIGATQEDPLSPKTVPSPPVAPTSFFAN